MYAKTWRRGAWNGSGPIILGWGIDGSYRLPVIGGAAKNSEVNYLGIGYHVLEIVHRGERNIEAVEQSHPIGAFLSCEYWRKLSPQLPIILPAQLSGGEPTICSEVGPFDDGEQRGPEFV